VTSVPGMHVYKGFDAQSCSEGPFEQSRSSSAGKAGLRRDLRLLETRRATEHLRKLQSRMVFEKRECTIFAMCKPLVLAVAFSAHDTLGSTSGIDAQTSPADVPELLRPTAAALHTLRELDQLGIPMALFGDLPKPLLDCISVVLWFSGQVVSVADPLAALPSTFGLPAACIWFVTADGDEAQRAVDAGFTAVQIAAQESAAIEAPDRRGVYVLNTIEDLLDAIRAPYM
jgi:hypothetical protein